MAQRLESQRRPESETSFFEAQMRRRVFWQVLWIDGRASQLAGQHLALSDTRDVALPRNLNDADMYHGMAEMPSVHDRATEMIFCLTRYEVGAFLAQHATRLHDPCTPVSEKYALIDELESLLDSRYLRHCDPAVSLHRMASGGARSAICKMRLMARHPSLYPDNGKSLPQSEHNLIFTVCVEMVELHVLGYSSKDVAKFSWHLDTTFQLDAVVLMLIESQTQPPAAPLTEKSWGLISEVFKYRPDLMNDDHNELYGAVRELVLRTWTVREAAAQKSGLGQPMPSATIIALKERSGRLEESDTSLGPPLVDFVGVTGTSRGSHDATEVMNDENNLDVTSFDWNLMDISSWDRWSELLQIEGA
jgi:hypothetical protein